MKCPEELELFLLREGQEDLSPERQKEVADHLASCSECQGKLAELLAIGSAIGKPDKLSEVAKLSFLSEVIENLETRRKSAPPPRPRSKLLIASVGIGAACTVLLFVIIPSFLMLDRGAEQAAVSTAPTASPAPPSPARSLAEDSLASTELPAQAAPAPAEPEADRESLALERRSRVRKAMGQVQSAKIIGGYGGEQPSAALGNAASGEGDRFNRRGAPSRPSTIQRTAPRPSAIDPNGRFATTYRPGRGHMARFERTLLQGRQVPEPVIQLVADEGRGHGPNISAPADRALALDVRPGMSQLPPSGGPVHLSITLRSTPQPPRSRPEVAVHLVMDTSGSMSGQPIEQARQAARSLVGLLQPGDRFSLVSYSTNAQVVVPDGPVGSRRGQILSQVNHLVAQGGTNLEAGLRQGYEQARQSRSQRDAVQLVIVLSDGRPNQGVTDPWTLSEMSAAAFQAGAETTTIGVGDNYEPQVMSTIAEYGAGGYYYLPDASAIEPVLRAELDVRCQPVARGVELRVRLAQGVQLLQAYGSRRLNEMEAQRVRQTEVAIDHQSAHRDGINRDRQEDREGGMRFFIPGFARDDQHTILLRLSAPAGSAEIALADVELRYKDRVLGTNMGDERQIRMGYAQSAQAARTSQDRDVRRAVMSFRTGEAMVSIASRLSRGDNQDALALLYERVTLLRGAAEELNDANLRADAERLDAFRRALASRQTGNNLMTGSLLHRAGNGWIR